MMVSVDAVTVCVPTNDNHRCDSVTLIPTKSHKQGHVCQYRKLSFETKHRTIKHQMIMLFASLEIVGYR